MRTGPVLLVGELVTDVIARIADPIAPAGDTRARISMRPGGAGGNVAAWMGALGADVTLIAGVGDDDRGRALARELASRGAGSDLVVRPDAESGTVIALVDAEGERTMLTDAAASVGLTADVLPRGCFERCGHLHLSGYVLLDQRTRAAGLAALERAREAGMTTSIDPASAPLITDLGADVFRGLCDGVDVLLPAEDEAIALVGAGGPEALVDRLLALVPEVAVTLGARGAIAGMRGGAPLRAPVVDPRGPVVDLVGAGDAFVAGWLAAGARGADARERLCAGCEAGSRAVTVAGAWPPLGQP